MVKGGVPTPGWECVTPPRVEVQVSQVMSEAGDWQADTVLQILWSFVVKRAEREIDFIF